MSCVGVIAHESGYGTLGANLSSSDLRGLLPQHFSSLALPVMQVGLRARARVCENCWGRLNEHRWFGCRLEPRFLANSPSQPTNQPTN